ncbi:lysophospholipid acyltransferase family protein [Sorangium atrum]|uniref:Lysophospholipid acyltransferase family protein n=1 Tax=Sorangium atrum TaxID=2995308 RepID=A0ABT5BS42_9BACT|nr:lysophospholipid acyltransferase family protein [Sorangium aterium]MDC0676375.1 lysophospholipid acyltransferase family protein [Sorangium aterium]
MGTEHDRELEEAGNGSPSTRGRPDRTGPRQVVPSADVEDEEARYLAPIGPTEPSDGRKTQSSEGHAPVVPVTTEELQRQITELEARLKRMLAGGPSPDASCAAGGEPETERSPRQGGAPAASAGFASEPPLSEPGTARDVLSTDFYLRQWGRAGLRRRSEEVDEFGFDPKYEARYRSLFDFLHRHYFRIELEGIERIPAEGRCLVVSNHSGGPIPYDGLMLRAAVRREHPARRELRWLADDFVYYLPFAGTIMNRLGAVRACQENAERLLAGERLIAVFPEGVKGSGKLYKERYQLQRFGRGGFIRLCLRTRTPLVPCAIVGAEETNPLFYRVEHLTRALGIPYLPITPTFPALGPLGLVPAPTKWKIRLADPVRFDAYGPEAADDQILVRRLAERVRATIQGLIDETLATRKSIWFG